MAELALALAVLVATLWASRGELLILRALGQHRDQLFRLETQRAETLRLQQAEQRLAEIQRLTECAISGGTQVVRAVHKGIATVPFSVLENIPATRETTRVVRAVHDAISDGVYAGIGALNRGIGSRLRQGLSEPPPAAPTESEQDKPSP